MRFLTKVAIFKIRSHISNIWLPHMHETLNQNENALQLIVNIKEKKAYDFMLESYDRSNN